MAIGASLTWKLVQVFYLRKIDYNQNMKKYTWLVIVIILVVALLFAIFYQDIKRYWLPHGSPAERPVQQ